LAAVAAVLGYVCATQALAQTLALRNAERAHRLAPGNGQIAARLALSLVGAEATAADRKRADMIARGALLQDATAVAAVTTLGINAQVRGEQAPAERLFAYSQKLSRRQLQTQLWAIEHAVARDDVAGALQHYDIALRTSPTSASLLFPVLALATADPQIRTALTKTLAAKPSWSEWFISHVATHSPEPRSTAALFLELRRAGVAVPKSADTAVINALIDSDFVDEAWRYYASLTPAADRRISRDPRFVADTTTPSLFDWVPVNDASVTTSIQPSEKGGVFDFAAPASIGGALLRQLQLLPPGTYQITGRSSEIDQEERAQPYWLLSCRQDGRELGRVSLPNSAQDAGRFLGNFTVPADCPVQMLTLIARPSDAVAGLSGQISFAQLAPAQ